MKSPLRSGGCRQGSTPAFEPWWSGPCQIDWLEFCDLSRGSLINICDHLPFRGPDGPSSAPLPLAHLTSLVTLATESAVRQIAISCPFASKLNSAPWVQQLSYHSWLIHSWYPGFPIHRREGVQGGEGHDLNVSRVLLKYMSRGTWP